MTLRQFLIATSASAALAACNSADTPVDDTATPTAELTAAPVPTAAPDGTALMAGTWTVSEDASGARASFGEPNVAPSLEITCDTSTRAVTLTRQESAPGPAGLAPTVYAIEAGGAAARLDMVPAASGGAMMAEIDPIQPVFAGFSAGNTAIAFTSENGARAQYPSHPGIQRVLYACL